ncbi:NACHT domain protein [Pleurostoma richardsiae]|uniref:NACHT domain protein n=1 Tax=Pleurostoma richardsiae TaxID=41990 RepID=A0AA38SBC8_9PEZI|nr:NACHT domain protein [Pleurostoma richardsiae]
MVQIAGSSKISVVWCPSFPIPDSPSSAVSASRQNSWTVRDEIIQRFSEPASDAEKHRVDRYIKAAVSAYNDAVAKLKQTLKSEDVDAILSPTASTAAELHRVAIGIQSEQASALDRRKMARFVDVLDHYAGVFDVLVQCDFGYMTLIWGTLKFALVVSKNHYSMLCRFTDMMVEVGLNLSRVELYRHIFPTGRMLELVSELYAAILEFLQEMIIYTQKRTYKKFLGSLSKPFDIQYGRLVDRIRRLQQCIEDDARAGALVLQVVQTKSLHRHRIDLSLRRDYYEAALRDIHEGQITPLFTEIKKTLFHGFEIQASYHEQLTRTFQMTSSPAWAQWLGVEQQYVPSRFSHQTTLAQAECDAPDAATCLQWAAQARAESPPDVASAFLLWARGMTAQSAAASLIFQVLQQRPAVLSAAGLTMRSFVSANASAPRLWSLLLHLVRQLGGLMVYVCIGSVGPEEFAVVRRLVELCEGWDGPPINVVLVHPFDEGFARAEDCVDLDEKYDVHPSLTTTDALHHVVLLELDVPEALSETVRQVLWEALWREVRYAVIGIAVTQAVEEIGRCAREAAGAAGDAGDGVAAAAGLWLAAVGKWTRNKRAVNNMREQIQRHLGVVDIHLPAEVRTRLEQAVREAMGSRLDVEGREELAAALRNGKSRHLEQDQRNEIWGHIQDAIRPGTLEMFNAPIGGLVGEVAVEYFGEPPESEREARTVVQETFKGLFGWNGRWKNAFLDSKVPIQEGIVASINVGLVDVIDVIVSIL